MNKGIILYYLCTNPGCTYSEQKLVIRKPLVHVTSSNKFTFNVPKCCPKCKSELELLNFVSGSVEIEQDKIEN
jgi:hypothetical protein